MSAIISPWWKFRFRLERDVSLYGKTYAFFGINPSTADATINDATVRKGLAFVTRWGGWRFIVGNVSPARSTDVKGLATILVSNDVWQQNIDHQGHSCGGRHSCAVLGDQQKKRRDIWLTILQRCCEFCAQQAKPGDVRLNGSDGHGQSIRGMLLAMTRELRQ